SSCAIPASRRTPTASCAARTRARDRPSAGSATPPATSSRSSRDDDAAGGVAPTGASLPRRHHPRPQVLLRRGPHGRVGVLLLARADVLDLVGADDVVLARLPREPHERDAAAVGELDLLAEL